MLPEEGGAGGWPPAPGGSRGTDKALMAKRRARDASAQPGTCRKHPVQMSNLGARGAISGQQLSESPKGTGANGGWYPTSG